MAEASGASSVATGAATRQRLPWLALAILALFAGVALAAPWLAPHDPEIGRLAMRFKPPAWVEGGTTRHLLGTDHQGRDVLSRLIFGARISLAVGVAAVLVAGVFGTLLGMLAGYFRGWVDQVISRIIDAWLALPSLVFAIFLAALTTPSAGNIVLILSVVYWTRYARVVRGEVLSLGTRDFVLLARVAGVTPLRILWRHILPNIMNTTVVLATLMLGVVIVTEASLSFLGVGVPPPQPAWGLMLADGKKGLMTGYWWLTVFPGLAIMLVVLAASLAGDWLRDRLDPRLTVNA
ncbi:MAG: ABC transporter permease [Burkholderiales bacterium]|nr:ABC transporter permease [Burkholderiales bacterium]